MRNRKGSLFLIAAMTVLSLPAVAQEKPASDSVSQVSTTPAATPQTNLVAPSSFDQVVDRIVIRERAFNEQMRALQPLVETYIQTLAPDHELGLVPASDNYFLGRLNLKNGVEDRSFLEAPKGQGFLPDSPSLFRALYRAVLLRWRYWTAVLTAQSTTFLLCGVSF